MSGKPAPSPDTEAAWQEYLGVLQACRRRLLAHERCRDEGDLARALYDIQMLAATGFNIYVAPRRSHPNFYIHPVFMPFEVTWGQPCPDFMYRWAIVDGRNTYRVWGRRGTTRWAEIQVLDGFWGDPELRHVANIDLDQHTGPDGAFEIIFSPDRQLGEHWVEIPRTGRNIFLQSREAWWDWENDLGLQMRIEPLKILSPDEWVLSEAQINRRLREAGRWISKNTDFNINMISQIIESAGERNAFAVRWDGKDNGGHPNALKGRMVFDIAPDEAIIVEAEAPRAVYWSFSIADIWYQTPDYSYHQSSLNGAQGRIDSDNRFRVVMALEDPGVHNWIDLVGLTQGMANYRFYMPIDGYVPDPVVKKVKAKDVLAHLPSDTPRVTPQARREILARRARSSLARYGY
ncbi:MAG: hypothetical protein JO127_16045 [Caulobacteraceae bacterium]|nr:hypothetical protein [Caulobacteraceae bacterium]